MKVLRWLDDNAELVLLMVALVIMTIAMGMQIVARYIFNSPLSWSEELSRFMFVWSGFLSISYCIKKGIAIRIEQVVDFFPKNVKKIFDIVVSIVLIVYFVYLIPYAYDFLYAAVKTGQLAPAMQIPMSLVYVSPLLGFILAIIRLIQNIIKDARLLFVKEKVEE